MKRIKNILLALVLATLTLCSTACNNHAEAVVVDGEKPTNPIILLNGFETQTELSTLSMEDVLGKVELSKETGKVKQGDSSAKVTVIHNPYSEGESPRLYQATDLVVRAEDYSNFDLTKLITLDVFNANSTTQKIGLQLCYNNGNSVSQWYDLEANCWTTINFKVSRESIPVITDHDNSISKVKGVWIMYERPIGSDNIFYIDNLCLYRTHERIQTITKTLKEDEINSFDSWWQVASLATTGGNYAPQIEWVKAYFVDGGSTDNGAMIKVNAPSGSDAVWPTFKFDTEYCSLINFGNYSGNDKFEFDVYIPQGQEAEISVLFTNAGYPSFSEQIILESGKWTTISYTVDYILSHPYEAGMFYKFDRTSAITIGYRGILGSEMREIYFDNFRMVKVAGGNE